MKTLRWNNGIPRWTYRWRMECNGQCLIRKGPWGNVGADGRRYQHCDCTSTLGGHRVGGEAKSNIALLWQITHVASKASLKTSAAWRFWDGAEWDKRGGCPHGDPLNIWVSSKDRVKPGGQKFKLSYQKPGRPRSRRAWTSCSVIFCRKHCMEMWKQS